jgi:putative phage-type endonuclease
MKSRLDGMGSTDVVEVSGLAPWQGAGPWRTYNVKIGVTQEDSDVTEEMAWGNAIEPFLTRWYQNETNRPYHHFARGELRLHSDRHPWLWASPDARGRDDFLEIKNVGSFMAHLWDRSDDDGIPDHVRGQVTIGMYCAYVKEWTVIAAIGGLPPRIYHVQFDAELAEMLVEAGRKFWMDHVVPRVPPELDGSDACREYLRKKYPRDDRPRRDSTIEEDVIACLRREASAVVSKNVAMVKSCDAKLLAALGDAKGITGDGWKLTSWVDKASGQRRTRFTVTGDDNE